MNKITIIMFSAITILQGCSGSSVKQQVPADVTSNPSGATVYADGEKLGQTPLHYQPYEVFPASWGEGAYQAQGKLMVKMKGCEDYALKVSDSILSQPIHADLKCDGVITTEKSKMPEPVSHGTEKRLEELEALNKKGVITEDEYKATRKRILNEL